MPRARRWRVAAGLGPGTGRRQPVRLWQLALGVLAGNLLLHQLPVLPGTSLLPGLALTALLGARACPLAGIAILAFCWTGWVAAAGLDARWSADADGTDVELIGWIDGLPERDSGRTVFTLRVAEAASGQAPRRVRLSWYDPAPELRAGQSLAIEARLRSPRGLVNPGGFDYERWLFLERIDATGYVRRGRADPGRRFGLAQTWLEFRATLAERIERRVEDADAAALIQALSLGERSRFEDRHWRVLQRTGTSHLVAVSGLHIGLIAALSFSLFLRCALSLPYVLARHARVLAAASSLLPATAYAALAGWTLPTRRALIMLLVLELTIIARRQWPVGSGLGLALIVILVLDPLASLTASFWLSFGAVALLLAATLRLDRPAGETRVGWRVWPAAFCRLQLALTLGLAPLVIWFFGQVSVVSLVVNLVAIPVFGFVVVPLSLITVLLTGLESHGFGLVPLTGTIASLAWRALDAAAGLELAAFALPRPPFAVLGLALAAVAMSVTRHRLPGRHLALLALAPIVLDHGKPPEPGFARATVFDVGHGLAVGIETANHRLLYDAGPLFRSGFDAGAQIVGPALAAQGPGPLDLLILSHGDSDHAGGARAVLARYPKARVMASPDVDGIAAERCEAGQAWTLDDVRFRVLHPSPDTSFTGNDSSCVIVVETRAGRLLLTGDIEKPAEARLMGVADLAADVVVVPHHGSQTSSTSALVAAVRPSAAIVSAAYNNRWNFPRPDVRRRWQDAGARVWVTGDLGAIDVTFDADGITLSALGQARRRYWQAKRGSVSGAADGSAL